MCVPCQQNCNVCVFVGRVLMCVCPLSAELQCVCFCWQSVNVCVFVGRVLMCVCFCWQSVNVCVSLLAEC